MTTLAKAHHQWATRPADERFDSVAALHADALSSKTEGRIAKIDVSKIRVIANGDDLLLQGDASAARFNHWSFGQISQRAKAPAAYMRQLPMELAASCINDGLAKIPSEDRDARLMFKANGGNHMTLRAVNGEGYSRIWDADITSRLLQLEAAGGWNPAPAAYDGARGLYRGDRDMFAFMVDNSRRVFESAPGGGMSRGFFVWNSEVGSASFGVMTFLYNYICGNHYVWGASGVKEFRQRHVGNADEKAFKQLAIDLKVYGDASAKEDESKLKAMMECEIAGTKDEILDVLFGLRQAAITKTVAADALKIAEEKVEWYGNPRSVWGVASGLTQIARDLPNANDRVALERATEKVMEIAF